MSSPCVQLVASDRRVFSVPRNVIGLSNTINTMLKDLGVDEADECKEPIPMLNVSGEVFEKVLKWLEHHKDDATYVDRDNREKETDDITAWDRDFLNVDQQTLFELMLAANYLDIKALLDSCCKTVANMMKGKSTEELRSTFNVTNDLSPEEESDIHRENTWLDE